MKIHEYKNLKYFLGLHTVHQDPAQLAALYQQQAQYGQPDYSTYALPSTSTSQGDLSLILKLNPNFLI